MYGFVYVLRNKENGKRYVGQTTHTPEWRLKRHFSEAKHPHSNMILSLAIVKYGEDAFEIEQSIPCLSADEMNELEKKLIHQLKTKENGYNIRDGGHGLSVEDRERMSYIMKEKCSDPVYRQRLSEQKREWGAKPEVKQLLSDRAVQKWQDPVKRQNMQTAATEGRRKQAHNMTPEEHQQLRDSQQKRWTPEARAKASETTKQLMNDEYKERIAGSVKQLWQTPEYRSKMLSQLQASSRQAKLEKYRGQSVDITTPDGYTYSVARADFWQEAIKLGLKPTSAVSSLRTTGKLKGYHFTIRLQSN